jgi:hypothetical protein
MVVRRVELTMCEFCEWFGGLRGEERRGEERRGEERRVGLREV